MLTVCYILNYFSVIESFLIEQYRLLRIDLFALTLRLEVQCHKAGLEVTPASYFIFLYVFNTFIHLC